MVDGMKLVKDVAAPAALISNTTLQMSSSGEIYNEL
jgi:hypothetical protein